LQTTLDRRRALSGPDSPEVAESLVALGLLRVGQAQYDEAERLVRDGLAMSKRHLLPNDPAVARATTALGEVLVERGEYPAAIEVLEEAVRLHSERESASADLAASLRQLANTHFYAGNYDTADELARRVLLMTRQLNGERHPLVAEDLINLGAVQNEARPVCGRGAVLSRGAPDH
jgi:serine/threonine-protein kinase